MVLASFTIAASTCAEIARSATPTGLLAQRYRVSTETIRKWRKRGTKV